jgi:hypothetical protein
MTKTLSDSTLSEYVDDMQAMTTRLLERFRETIGDDHYKRLSFETFDGETLEEAESHFLRIMSELKRIGEQQSRDEILERIRKGESFIATLDKSDRRYKAAEDKLCTLIEELGRIES